MSEFEYDAFISYRHLPLDKAVASKLQNLLETYRPPKGISYRHTGKIKRIFRDNTELPTNPNLDDSIKEGLRKSRFLIVVLTSETIQSKWCEREIKYFKEIHEGSTDNILTVLAEGEPQTVFFPDLCVTAEKIIAEDGAVSYREKEVEPLCTDVRAKSVYGAKRKLKSEFLRIAAFILGCKYSELNDRHQRRKVRRVIAASASCVALSAAVAVTVGVFENRSRNAYASLYYKQGVESIEKYNDPSLGMMYFSDSVSLRPNNTAPQTSMLALLLQNNSWSFVDRVVQGRIFGDSVVTTRSIIGNQDIGSENVWVLDDSGAPWDLEAVLAVNKQFDRVLSVRGDCYAITDGDGKPVNILPFSGASVDFELFGDVNYVKTTQDDSCWIFQDSAQFIIYNIADDVFQPLAIPRNINPQCAYGEFSMPDIAVYNGGGNAVVACNGYVYFYDEAGGSYEQSYVMDLAEAFTNQTSGSEYLSDTNKVYVGKNGQVLAVTNYGCVCVTIVNSKSSTEIQQYAYLVNDIAFSDDDMRIAVSYGSGPLMRSGKKSGFLALYTINGVPLFESPEDTAHNAALVRFSGGGDAFITMDYHKTVRIWSVGDEGAAEFCNPARVGNQAVSAAFGDGDYAFAVEDNSGTVYMYSMLTPRDKTVLALDDARFPILYTKQTAPDQLAVLTANALYDINLPGYEIMNEYYLGDTEYDAFIQANRHVIRGADAYPENDADQWILDALYANASRDYREQNGEDSLGFVSDTLLLPDQKRVCAIGGSRPFLAVYDVDYASHALTLAHFQFIDGDALKKLWRNASGNAVMIMTADNELLVYNSQFTGEENRIRVTDGEISEVTCDDSITFLAVSVTERAHGLRYGRVSLWDIVYNSEIMNVTDGHSDMNGLCFAGDNFYYGTEDTLNRIWLPKSGLSRARNAFFKSLSGYQTDKNLIPQPVSFAAPDIRQALEDDWSALYEIQNNHYGGSK